MGATLDSLRVVPFTDDRVPNEYPGGHLPWQVYHEVRNALVRACRPFGPVGPVGVVRLDPDAESPYYLLARDASCWEPGDPNPHYFLLDDQLNHERYCYAELSGDDPLHAGWLLAVVTALREFEGWGLAVQNIPDSYVLIFGDRLLVNGKLARCRTAGEVVGAAGRLLRGRPWWKIWG